MAHLSEKILLCIRCKVRLGTWCNFLPYKKHCKHYEWKPIGVLVCIDCRFQIRAGCSLLSLHWCIFLLYCWAQSRLRTICMFPCNCNTQCSWVTSMAHMFGPRWLCCALPICPFRICNKCQSPRKSGSTGLSKSEWWLQMSESARRCSSLQRGSSKCNRNRRRPNLCPSGFWRSIQFQCNRPKAPNGRWFCFAVCIWGSWKIVENTQESLLHKLQQWQASWKWSS